MINTMYQEKSGDYIRKPAELSILAYVEKKGSKKIGSFKIDLAEAIPGISQKFFQILECPDKKASVCISVKCTSLGDGTIVDNVSESSMNSGISMGTEGDFSGNLFDSVEEEGKRPISSSSKPPLMKKRTESTEQGGNTDEVAMVKVLQKENSALKKDKEEAKIQLNIFLEKMKKEREQYCEHVERLEGEIDVAGKKVKKIRNKYKIAKESVQNNYAKLEEVNNEMEEYKLRYNHLEKKKMRDQIKTLTGENYEIKEKVVQMSREIADLREEKAMFSAIADEFKMKNEKLLKEFESFKEETDSNRESVVEASLPQNNYRKKTKDHMNKLKNELKVAQEEIEELRAVQTDWILKAQQQKIAFGAIENSLKEQVRKLEFDLREKNEEITEVNLRLEEEIHNSKQFERKTITEKVEIEDKVVKLSKNLEAVACEKEIIHQNYIEIQRKHDRTKNADMGAVTILEGTLVLSQKEVARLEETVKLKENRISQLEMLNEKLENELSRLNEHIKTISATDLSDPASASLEKIAFLEEKLTESEISHDKAREKLLENIKVLEKQLEISDAKHKDLLKIYEEKIDTITFENIMLKSQSKEVKTETSAEFISAMTEETFKEKLDELTGFLLESEKKSENLSENLKELEEKCQEGKLLLAKKDLEKENLQGKYREAQEQLREYSSQYTVLEVELYKINERFGQALNSNNELENQIQDIKEKVFNMMLHKKKR